MLPRSVSILGVGLLGGSIGLALRASGTDCLITGYGHRRPTLDAALSVGAIDRVADSPARAVEGADLVVLCTPVGLMGSMLERIAPALSPDAVVTDVGSTKASICRAAGRLMSDPGRFVGSHPMAGSEKRGIEFARADLFAGAVCILTPLAWTAPAAVRTVEGFWNALGMRCVRATPAVHDRLLADISHLPHVLAAALVHMQSEAGLDLAGKGFLDSTRIAGGDGALWRDILMDNRANLRRSLGRLRTALARFESLLDRPAALAAWLNRAAARRSAVLARKLREVTPD